MNQVVTETITNIDDLDLRGCIVSDDLIARIADNEVTVYRHDGRRVELLGVFEGPAAALEVLDMFDAPAVALERHAQRTPELDRIPFGLARLAA